MLPSTFDYRNPLCRCLVNRRSVAQIRRNPRAALIRQSTCRVADDSLLLVAEGQGALVFNCIPDADRPQRQWKQGKSEHFRIAVVKVGPKPEAANDEHKDRARHPAAKRQQPTVRTQDV